MVNAFVSRDVGEVSVVFCRNHEMGTKAQPKFLSVIVSIMSLLFCGLEM